MQTSLDTAAAAIALAISGWTTWIIIALITKNFICSLFCASLARAKGYSEITFFLLGIFFGELVLLYMVGMPLSYEEEHRRQMQLAVVLADAGFVEQPTSENDDQEELDTTEFDTDD